MREKHRGTLAQQAYEQIWEQMLKGDLTFGTPLSRRDLAKEFDMSIAPVSEALQRLENEGLIESWPRVGTRVKVPTSQDIRDFYIVREALETQAARLFAEKASTNERQELRKMAADLDAFYEKRSKVKAESKNYLFELHRRHTRFHMRIAECTGSKGLCQALEKNHILVFHWLYDTTLGNSFQPSNWHQKLMHYIAGRNVERADAAMRAHVRMGLEDHLKNAEPYAQMGSLFRNPYSASLGSSRS